MVLKYDSSNQETAYNVGMKGTANMNKKEATELFGATPCEEALVWLSGITSLQEAWDTCKRGDWMWWGITHLEMPTKEESVAFAKWAAYASAASAAYAADAAYAAHAAAYAADAYAAYYAERLAQAEWIRSNCKRPF